MKPDLYTIRFYRFIRTSKTYAPKIVVPVSQMNSFGDLGKINIVEWKLDKIIGADKPGLEYYIYSLNEKTLETMKKIEIIEETADRDNDEPAYIVIK